jgi:hypothetical protein
MDSNITAIRCAVPSGTRISLNAPGTSAPGYTGLPRNPDVEFLGREVISSLRDWGLGPNKRKLQPAPTALRSVLSAGSGGGEDTRE